MTTIGLLAFAMIIDLIIGEIDYPLHPIRLIGNYIAIFQKTLRKPNQTSKTEKLLGVLLIMSLLIIVSSIVFLLTRLTSGLIGALVDLYLMYSVMSIGCLKAESMKVYDALKEKDIEKSREMVGRIVGRDTTQLTENEIIKATIETVAENTSDGGIGPLMYLILGGPVLAFIYKAINTMDSMVGYKSDKYLHFGRYPAKLDDVANFIPARITAVFMLLACGLMKLDSKAGFAMMKRDAKKHKSPNAGFPEAAIAGALGIQLGGDSVYFGKVVKKATLSDKQREVTCEDIKKTNDVLYVSGILFVVVGLGLRLILL